MAALHRSTRVGGKDRILILLTGGERTAAERKLIVHGMAERLDTSEAATITNWQGYCMRAEKMASTRDMGCPGRTDSACLVVPREAEVHSLPLRVRKTFTCPGRYVMALRPTAASSYGGSPTTSNRDERLSEAGFRPLSGKCISRLPSPTPRETLGLLLCGRIATWVQDSQPGIEMLQAQLCYSPFRSTCLLSSLDRQKGNYYMKNTCPISASSLCPPRCEFERRHGQAEDEFVMRIVKFQDP